MAWALICFSYRADAGDFLCYRRMPLVPDAAGAADAGAELLQGGDLALTGARDRRGGLGGLQRKGLYLACTAYIVVGVLYGTGLYLYTGGARQVGKEIIYI